MPTRKRSKRFTHTLSDRAARSPASDHLRFLLTFILAVGALYAGRSVILPLALSVLLAFVLTPMVIAVQKRGLARVPAVLIVLCFSLMIAGGVGYGVGTQVSKLANQLPDYVSQVNDKIVRLRASTGGRFSKTITALENIGQATDKTNLDSPAGKSKTNTAATQPTVVVAAADSSALDRLASVAAAVLEPVADAALIFILVAFMLIRREDLRNRVIGLLGHGRLTGTTRVFVESAERISRLLLMQLCVNTGFGLIFGLVLLILGVQYWFLWGFLTVVLRFVPYIGSWLAAMLPVLLSFATSTGYAQPISVLGCFIVLDLVTANVIEPLLFGHSTGVTPVALLVAAVFWAWIWGPLGLVLSTPLTVCLVVMGQNIPSLRFLSLLMGDKAALLPHVAYYQRLLAGDRHEALQVAKAFSTSTSWDQLPDGVVVPALKLARRDRKHSGLTAEDEAFILDSSEAVIDSLRNQCLTSNSPPGVAQPVRVLGCASHHRAEEFTLQLLSCVLLPDCAMEVLSTRMLPLEIEAKVEQERPAVVFIAILPPGGISQAKHLCKRLRKRFPDLKIVVGFFGKARDYDHLLTVLRAAGASYVSTSVLQSRNQIRSLLPTPVPALLSSATEVSVVGSS